MTNILKGENGSVSKRMSKKVSVEFDETQHAFETLRSILASEDVILMYSDFKKAFDLTTYASSTDGIGAVLSQDSRPIIMNSKTLK